MTEHENEEPQGTAEEAQDGVEEAQGIAIIGMAGRFPGAPDLATFWRNLESGTESVESLSREELLAAGVREADLDDPGYVAKGSFLQDPEYFDAAFFGLNAREAELMDPQHRLFLEQSWQALEDAGYDAELFSGAIGVFGGMNLGSYLVHHLLGNEEALSGASPVEIRIKNDKDFLASLVAYKLGCTGPSFSVQTACSTSLVAMSLACQSLLSYQSDMALAGGVSIRCPTRQGFLAQDGVYSPDGHCRAFDAAASGTIGGDGVGVVVLKRLADALADGDHVRAVITGFATNNDGSLKVGYTAPSVEGQAEVIAMAQALAGVDPETITAIEAHGTGTPMGDPIEVQALSEVFRQDTDRRGFCALGSVKTNVGHLDAAAGVASVIKTVLAMEHGTLPPSLNFETPNPAIDFEASPFYVNTRATPWEPPAGVPRRAGVSAFAVGGVNAHLVMEEAPPAKTSGPSRPWQMVMLSARSESALETATDLLVERLKQGAQEESGGHFLADVAHTLQVGRHPFEVRRLALGTSPEGIAEVLEKRAPDQLLGATPGAGRRPLTFLFPGLGNHYPGMARDLYEGEPTFRDTVDRCADLLAPTLGVDLRHVLYGEEDRPGGGGEGLDLRRMLGRGGGQGEAGGLRRTLLAQPAVFVVELALARLLMEWGLEPEAMVGYSIGEYVAACLAGVFTLEQALELVALRAREIDALPAGSMLAVSLAEEDLLPKLGENLAVSAVAGPEITVVGGPEDAVSALARQLEDEEVMCRPLETTHAFHTPMMQPMVAAWTERVSRFDLQPPEIPFLSNVTGTWITEAEATDPAYWARHLVEPVRFSDNLEVLWQESDRVFLEVGPGQTLGAWALQHPGSAQSANPMAISCLRHVYDRQSDLAFLLRTVGRLWLAGVEPDWEGFYQHEERHRLPLPTYPFERRRYWIEPRGEVKTSPRGEVFEAPKVPQKVADLEQWFWQPVWRQVPAVTSAFTGAKGKGTAVEPGRQFLILGEGAGLGEALATHLENGGSEVLRRSGEGTIEWVQTLATEGKVPPEIVYCASIREESGRNGSHQDCQDFMGLLRLAQALTHRADSSPLRITVLGDGLCDVGGGETVVPAKAAVLGPVRVIPQEMPEVHCRAIDVLWPEEAARRGVVVEQLGNLLRAEEASADLMALRGPRLWRQDFEALNLGSITEEEPSGGGFLVTGGLGGIGLVLAEKLARGGSAKLALVTRTALPARESWDDLAAQDGATAEKVRSLQGLEALGAEVLTFAADVTDRQAMASVVSSVVQQFGGLAGMVHAAGVFPGGLIQLKTPEAAQEVLAPKVAGTQVLADLLADLPQEQRPRFMLLCSSLTSEMGGLGLVDHVGANAALDAFAVAALQTSGIPTLTVCWDTWLEVGQAARGAKEVGITAPVGSTTLDRSQNRSEERLAAQESAVVVDHPLLQSRIDREGEILFRATLSGRDHWVVNEHRLGGQALLPGTACLEMVWAALHNVAGTDEALAQQPVVVENLVFAQPLTFDEVEHCQMELSLRFTPGDADSEYELTVRSGAVGRVPDKEHFRGLVRRDPEIVESIPEDLEALRSRLDAVEFSAGPTAEAGLDLGPRWSEIEQQVWRRDREALCRFQLAERFEEDLQALPLHPALLDCATGFIRALEDELFLPMSYDRVILRGSLSGEIYSHLRRAEELGGTLVCDLGIFDGHGLPRIEIEGYTMRQVPSTVGQPSEAPGAGSGGQGILQVPTLEGITPADGAAVFDRLLPRIAGLVASGVPRLLVSVRPLKAWMRYNREASQESMLAEVEGLEGRRTRHPRPALATPLVAPRTDLEKELVELWQGLIGLESLGIHDNFFDVGGDSLLATQLLGKIRNSWRIDLPLRDLFASPTVAELAVCIVERQVAEEEGESVDDMLAEIESLSEEELAALLEAEKNALGGTG